LERREHPERFVVVTAQEDTNSNNISNIHSSRRGKYAAARQVAILLAVAQQDSIMHACISIKDHHGCRLKIRTKDVIFLLTKTSKQEVAFSYQDEYIDRSVLYNVANNNNNNNDSSTSSDEEYYGDY
jgi:hypothetical protein